MNLTWPIAALPIVGLLANVAVHIMCIRLQRQRWPHLALAIGAAFGGATLVVASLELRTTQGVVTLDEVATVFMLFGTYGALSYGYFAFANLTITSLRIRLLQDIDDAEGSVRHEDVFESYNVGDVLDARLERLVSAGQLVQHDGRYVATAPILLWLAFVLDGLRALVFGRAAPH